MLGSQPDQVSSAPLCLAFGQSRAGLGPFCNSPITCLGLIPMKFVLLGDPAVLLVIVEPQPHSGTVLGCRGVIFAVFSGLTIGLISKKIRSDRFFFSAGWLCSDQL